MTTKDRGPRNSPCYVCDKPWDGRQWVNCGDGEKWRHYTCDDPELPIPASSKTLRDWFAGMAMSPMLVQAYGNTPHYLAEHAFKIADALLAEREKRDE